MKPKTPKEIENKIKKDQEDALEKMKVNQEAKRLEEISVEFRTNIKK